MTDPADTDFDVVVGRSHPVMGTYDTFGWLSDNNVSLANNITVGHIRLGASSERQPLGNLALPTGPLDLSDWDAVWLTVASGPVGDDAMDWNLTAEVTSMALVPEPGTLVLIAVGGILVRRRRLPV